jgi:hypothetical protein
MSNHYVRPAAGASVWSNGVIILAVLAVAFAIVAISAATKIYHDMDQAAAEAREARSKQPPLPDQPEDAPSKETKGADVATYLSALLSHEKYALGPLFVWSALNCIIAALAAVWLANAAQKPPEAQTASPHKMVILSVGGLLGLSTVVFPGLYQAFLSWKTLTGSRENWTTLAPWIPVIAMLAGLGIMFVSLLAVRSEERRNANLRRLLYGYNAFLCCLLLLGNLVVLNVMTFFYFTYSYDWTGTGMFSLSGQSRQVVAGLDKPVKIYVIMSPVTEVAVSSGMQQRPQPVSLLELYRDLQALLSAIQQHSDKIQVEYLAPEAPEKSAAISQLFSKYDILPPGGVHYGVLVVYDPDGTPAAQFLGLEDLEKDVATRLRRRGETREFVAEQTLIKTLLHFQEGGTQSMLLFTRGSGEMTLTPAAGGPAEGPVHSLSRLRSALRERGGYECREFPLGEIEAATGKPRTVPQWVRLKTPAEQRSLSHPEEDWMAITAEEAGKRGQDKDRKYFRVLALVMADPQDTLNPAKVQVVRDYLKEPYARLIALLDVHRTTGGAVKLTGLEELLREHGVTVGRDQVLQPGSLGERLEPTDPRANPGTVRARVHPSADPGLYHSMRTSPFLLQVARSVMPPMSRTNLVRPLLATAEVPHWMERDAFKDPLEHLSKLKPADIQARLLTQHDEERDGFMPVFVAVTVHRHPPTAAAPAPNVPPSPPVPFLAVFGDATFLNDAQPFTGTEEANYLLFSNTLAWVRGRPEILAGTGERPKVRTSYPIHVEPTQVPVVYPGLLLLLAIAAAGIGVALLRRR